MMHANEHPRPMPDDWRNHAACRGMDPDLFQPHGGNYLRLARSTCNACPVADACLQHALTLDDDPAMLGGKTPAERAAMLPPIDLGTRKPVDHGTVAGYRAHRRIGHPPCQPCIDAHTAYGRATRIARDAASGQRAS